MLTKIKDSKTLVKDLENRAILNIDNTRLSEYKSGRKKRKQNSERINNLEHSVKRIEEMLSVLLERIKG